MKLQRIPFWLVLCALLCAGTLSAAEPRLYVALIGGMDSDPTPAQIAGTARRSEGNSGMFRLQGDLQDPRVTAEYFNWNGTLAGQINAKSAPGSTAICEQIRNHMQLHPQDRLAVVGNSWGGHTAHLVCQSLFSAPAPLAVDLVVFLDPSSTGRKEPAPRDLPLNVKRAINYHTRNAFVWRPFQEPRLINVDLGRKESGFLQSGGPDYASLFSFDAHVAAEWDERIHKDIRNHVLELLAQ